MNQVWFASSHSATPKQTSMSIIQEDRVRDGLLSCGFCRDHLYPGLQSISWAWGTKTSGIFISEHHNLCGQGCYLVWGPREAQMWMGLGVGLPEASILSVSEKPNTFDRLSQQNSQRTSQRDSCLAPKVSVMPQALVVSTQLRPWVPGAPTMVGH